MHDLITFRGAGRPRSAMSDSKEEHDIIDLMNQKIADVDSNRPFSVKQRNVVRHGPQVNFMSHMLAHEADNVKAVGGGGARLHVQANFQSRCSTRVCG